MLKEKMSEEVKWTVGCFTASVVLMLLMVVSIMLYAMLLPDEVFIGEHTVSYLPVAEEVEVKYLFGVASWYDYDIKPDGSTNVCFTSKGESCYTEHANVAAMRDVPRGTTVRVRRTDTRAVVEVKITDYGPDVSVHPDRVIDLSSYAFNQLGSPNEGTFPVVVSWE